MLVTVNPTVEIAMFETLKLRSLNSSSGTRGSFLVRAWVQMKIPMTSDAGDDHAPHGDGSPDHTPVVVLRLLQSEDDEEEADGAEQHTDDVEAMRVGRQVRHQDRGHHERDDADRDVDEEDPLPPEAVDEKTTGQRADQRGDTGGRAPQTHGGAAVGGREGAGDDSHRLRRHERGAETLHGARDDQQRRACPRARSRAKRG